MSAKAKQRLLLVAKPWKGGLAHYLFRAMQRRTDCQVDWISTTPGSFSERLAYRRDRRHWRKHLVAKIESLTYDQAVFVNFPPGFEELKAHPGNILWLTDDPRPVLPIASSFPRIFISDPGYLLEAERLLAPGQVLKVLPFACDPTLHRPLEHSSQRSGMCFIANRDSKRDEFLRQFFDSGRTLTVYGNHIGRSRLFWGHPTNFRPEVDFSGQGEVYARYAASLNIHAAVVRGGTNMRTFECAACAIPQLVEWLPGIEDYLEPEKELLLFRSVDELFAQYDRLMNDAGLQVRLAENARMHVLTYHTYDHRLSLLLRGS